MTAPDMTPAAKERSAAPSLWSLLRRIHRDEKGAVSIETILIVAAIAIPILIFIIKFGWPRIKTWFNQGMDELEGGMDDAAGA
jgi:Flp pilus assembly pilin Flp